MRNLDYQPQSKMGLRMQSISKINLCPVLHPFAYEQYVERYEDYEKIPVLAQMPYQLAS